jgi:DNA-binding transcriptional MocR family regulator
MICSTFIQNREAVVLVEDPTYHLSLGIFKDFPNIKGKLASTWPLTSTVVIGMPMDRQGVIVDDKLQELIIRHKPAMLYTIPTFHNPTGIKCEHTARLNWRFYPLLLLTFL